MKTLVDLSTEAQTWCHLGESQAEIYVKIMDSYYKVKRLTREHFDCVDKTYFIIDTEPISDK